MGTSKSALYLNPILLQTLAGATQRAFPEAQVELFDVAAGDSYTRSLENLQLDDLAVICISTNLDLHEFIRIAVSSLRRGVKIIIVGTLVTDAEPKPLLDRLNSILQNNPAYAFVGRETDRFLQMINAISLTTSIHELPNTVSVLNTTTERDWQPLPPITSAPFPLFSHEILQAIEDRGMATLVEGLTRGCEYHCTYCHLNFNKQTRGRVQDLTDDALERILYVVKRIPKNTFIFFTDENFFGGRADSAVNRLNKIMQLSMDLRSSGVSRALAIDTRIDSLSNPAEDAGTADLRRRAWKSFESAGLKYAYLGVESFSESQLRRYAKSSEYRAIIPGITTARDLGLAFTLGMIIMDPLVTPLEIGETLGLIDRLNLYSHIASPLKPLRLGHKSPYAGWVTKQLPSARWNALPTAVEYFRDARIREIWPALRRVHSLFAESGYRHSDVAMFDSVFGPASRGSGPVSEIVGRMECEILGTLIDSGPTDSALRLTLRAVEGAVQACILWLVDNRDQAPSSIEEKVVRYYGSVLGRIQTEIAQHQWLEEAFCDQ